MYPAERQKIPTQTVDSSQVFEKWILQKQPKIINKMTKHCDKNTIKNLEQVCSFTTTISSFAAVKDNFT